MPRVLTDDDEPGHGREVRGYGDWPISAVRKMLDNAAKVAADMGLSEDEAPFRLGTISTEPIPPEALERASRYVRKRGWVGPTLPSREEMEAANREYLAAVKPGERIILPYPS